MNSAIFSKVVGDPVTEMLHQITRLLALHLIKSAITLLDDTQISTETLGDIEKQRASIDSDIKEQQMIVDRLLNKSSSNTTPLQVTVGVTDATSHTSRLP